MQLAKQYLEKAKITKDLHCSQHSKVDALLYYIKEDFKLEIGDTEIKGVGLLRKLLKTDGSVKIYAEVDFEDHQFYNQETDRSIELFEDSINNFLKNIEILKNYK